MHQVVAKSLLAVLLVPTFLHWMLLAQAPPRSPEALRSILVNVIDSHGAAVRDLTKENFAIFLNGKLAAVTAAQYSLAPHRIIVLLDVSGSMNGKRGSGKWRIAEEAVRDLLQQSQVDVQIAMVTFSDEVHEISDFSQSRAAILNWLQQNPDEPPKLTRKHTALFDATIEALKLFGDARPGDAIYAITDGNENASDSSARQTQHVLLLSGVRLFTLLFARPFGSPQAWQERTDDFVGMVRDSGGLAFELMGHRIPGVPLDAEYSYNDNRETVKAYTTELDTQISGYWTLELTAPASQGKSKIRVTVTDHTGRERKDIVVVYPHILLSAN